MKISNLIEQLEKFKKEYGDVPVLIQEDGFGGRIVRMSLKIEEELLYSSELEEADLYKEDIIELMDGDVESLEEDKEIKCKYYP